MCTRPSRCLVLLGGSHATFYSHHPTNPFAYTSAEVREVDQKNATIIHSLPTTLLNVLKPSSIMFVVQVFDAQTISAPFSYARKKYFL